LTVAELSRDNSASWSLIIRTIDVAR